MSESPQNERQCKLSDLGYTPEQMEQLKKVPLRNDLIIAGRAFVMNVKTGEITEVGKS